MASEVYVEKTSTGNYKLVNTQTKVKTPIALNNLGKMINEGRIVKVFKMGGVPQVWTRGTARRIPFVAVNVKPTGTTGEELNGTPNTKFPPYNLNAASPNAKNLFEKVKKIWKVTTDAPLQRWIGEQAGRIGADPRVIMESIVKHTEVLNKNSLTTAFAKLRSGNALYTAAPTGEQSANFRVNQYLRNVALDELVRKFTPSLRQAHSGSLFEQAAIAVAAKAAGKKVLSFPAIGTNFLPNTNQRANYQGNRVKQVWMNPNYRDALSGGVFVLKTAFGLARIKNDETNVGLQKLFFDLIKANSNNKNQESYNTAKIGGKRVTRKLSTLRGKNVNTSLWKGFYEVQPDVLYFVMKNGKLFVYIYEFKIGSGKAEQEPAEYFQLVKAKRTLELIFQKYPPGVPYEITIHFFPLKYRLVSNEAPTNFKHPTNSGAKWKDYYKMLTKSEYSTHGSYAIPKTTTPEDFKTQTGVDINVLKSVLNAYSSAEKEAIARAIRSGKRKGVNISSNSKAARTALTAYNVNNAVRRALEQSAMGAKSGQNYIANLMRRGIKTDIELIAALNYLDIAGYRLKKKDNASGNKLSIVGTLRIRQRGPANSYGSTWSGVKKGNKRTIDTVLARINAAKSIPTNNRNIVTEAILNKLENYEIVPPPPLFETNQAQNARVNMAQKANAVANAPDMIFDQVYRNFVRQHVSPNYGITKNNVRSAVENSLNRLAALARGRENTNTANYYTGRKANIPKN
jgi:hypothetical protein